MSKYVGQIPLCPPLSRGRKIGKFPLLIKRGLGGDLPIPHLFFKTKR